MEESTAAWLMEAVNAHIYVNKNVCQSRRQEIAKQLSQWVSQECAPMKNQRNNRINENESRIYGMHRIRQRRTFSICCTQGGAKSTRRDTRRKTTRTNKPLHL